MLKRLKNLWDISKQKPQRDVIVVKHGAMRPEEMKKLSEATGKVIVLAEDVNDFNTFEIPVVAEGDGKAEFLGEGSTDEFEEQEKKDKGQHGIFGIGL